MPSPTWSTVPTSARSVSTSKSLIRSFRIAVISSGRSFTGFLSGSGNQFSFQALQAAAHARVDAQRARLEDDAADQVWVDCTRRLDRAPGDALDLSDDLARLVLGELDRGRQLDVQLPLLSRGELLELAGDLVDLSPTPLLDQQAQQVEEERVGAARDRIDDGALCAPVQLRVAQDLLQLRDLLRRLDEVGQLLAHVRQAARLLRRLEEGAGVRPVDDRHAYSPAPAPAKPAPPQRRSSMLVVPLQHREVEVADRLLDQLAVVLAVEHLPRHLRGRDQRQLADLGPDLLERALRLGLDLPLRLLEPALTVGLGLLPDARLLGVRLLTGLGEDLLRLLLRLADELSVLLEQSARLLAGAVGLLDRLPDTLAAVVDRLLDRAERVPAQDEERDRERDQRPDHQAGDDLDQCVRGDDHRAQIRT